MSTENQKPLSQKEGGFDDTALFQQVAETVGDQVVHVVVRNVSPSGNSRCLDFFVIKNNSLTSISPLIAKVLGLKQSDKYFGLIVRGCGMDMAYACLYKLFSIVGLNPDNIRYSKI